MVLGQMEIKSGRFEIAMPQQDLYDAQVGAGFQQGSGEVVY